mmetsp:Transcript_16071/g.32380  ORF Transcript_16071/g.32380 Transcript_16071/m.32380 type:complete len:109 (+) Transcript_16071:2509-2835(+)
MENIFSIMVLRSLEQFEKGLQIYSSNNTRVDGSGKLHGMILIWSLVRWQIEPRPSGFIHSSVSSTSKFLLVDLAIVNASSGNVTTPIWNLDIASGVLTLSSYHSTFFR